MDHGFEMQPHGAPGPRTAFSRSHLLGHPARPSRLPGGVSPLIPVLRKTIHLDAFPQSHSPQASGRPGPGARTRSVSLQETGSSLVPRKLSTISLTLRQNSQAWGEAPAPGREAAIHRGGGLPTQDSPSVALLPAGRVHCEGPGNPGLAKPSRMPVVEKPLVSSYLALPFQSRSAQSPPGPAGSGSAGQRHAAPPAAHVPTRPSPGRGKSRFRGIPRPRLHLQRAMSTVEPATAVGLATLDTTRPGTGRYLATAATNRPNLAVSLATPNSSRLDSGTGFLALDARLGAAKRGLVTDRVTPGLSRLGEAMATAGTAKPHTTTGATALDLAARDPVKSGTARPDTVLALDRRNPARLDVTMDSLALDTSSVGAAMGSVVPAAPDPAIGETTPDSVVNLTTSDSATYPQTSRRSTDPGPDHRTADAAGDLPRETTGKCQEFGRAPGNREGAEGAVEGPGDGLSVDRSERKRGL